VSQKFASFRRNSVIWPIYIDSHLNWKWLGQKYQIPHTFHVKKKKSNP
jgi:hypothetical protein